MSAWAKIDIVTGDEDTFFTCNKLQLNLVQAAIEVIISSNRTNEICTETMNYHRQFSKYAYTMKNAPILDDSQFAFVIRRSLKSIKRQPKLKRFQFWRKKSTIGNISLCVHSVDAFAKPSVNQISQLAPNEQCHKLCPLHIHIKYGHISCFWYNKHLRAS